ncbi:hypothetical protein [Streptomyces sp. NPDC055749]
MRITFVQSRTNPATGSPEVKYRHVLLGWSYINSADHISFDGVHSTATARPATRWARTGPAM